jgi:Uma2 family endonuclease
MFAIYLADKKCQLFRENVDLLLADPQKFTAKELYDMNRENKVRPDLMVFCEKQFVLSRNNIVGIPDFIIEVLSPGSAIWDKKVKLKKYLDAGVKEYWIVDYNYEEILVYREGTEHSYAFNDIVKVGILAELSIDFSSIKKKIEDAYWY